MKVVKRTFTIDGDKVSTARIYEHFEDGRIATRQCDWSQLESLLNRLKQESGGDEKLRERVKQQGVKIGELTRKLKS